MARIASRSQTLATIIVLEDPSQRPGIEWVQPRQPNRFYGMKLGAASTYRLFVFGVNHQCDRVMPGKCFGLVVSDGWVGEPFWVTLWSQHQDSQCTHRKISN